VWRKEYQGEISTIIDRYYQIRCQIGAETGTRRMGGLIGCRTVRPESSRDRKVRNRGGNGWNARKGDRSLRGIRRRGRRGSLLDLLLSIPADMTCGKSDMYASAHTVHTYLTDRGREEARCRCQACGRSPDSHLGRLFGLARWRRQWALFSEFLCAGSIQIRTGTVPR